MPEDETGDPNTGIFGRPTAMRPARVPFTVRRTVGALALAAFLLVLVTVVTWFLSPEQVRLRSLINAYRANAERHAELEDRFSHLSEYSERSHGSTTRGGQLVHFPLRQRPELIPKYLELARYHGALRQKYEDAAMRPRFPVEPDPLPPEP
jgi:hypothetical protein